MGFSAHLIDAAHRGVGWLLAEGALPRRLRTFYLTDDDIRDLAARASAVDPATTRTDASDQRGEGEEVA